jgi:hypothetical protein
MFTTLDPRFRMALQNDAAAQSLLSDLHRQILSRPHSHVLAQLLAEYVLAAAARGGAAAAPQPRSAQERESLMASVLTNIANMKHEALKAIAQNLRG